MSIPEPEQNYEISLVYFSELDSSAECEIRSVRAPRGLTGSAVPGTPTRDPTRDRRVPETRPRPDPDGTPRDPAQVRFRLLALHCARPAVSAVTV